MTEAQYFQKRPVVVRAKEWTGNNLGELELFSGGKVRLENDILCIQTAEGQKTASIGDMIIKGMIGELYPCDPEVFRMMYEEVY
jgi:hypothetical protein